MKWSDLFKKKKANENNTSSAIEPSQEDVKNLEKILNWILPGCQLLYRDTNAGINPYKAYPIGKLIRAGFFIDTTARAQRPVTQLRYIIASAHPARLHEAMPDEDFKRWRLCTLHFNSYFKVMDVYQYKGVYQVLLLHIPYQALPLFEGEHSINLVQGAANMNFVEIARKSLETKMNMEVCEDTTDDELLRRMLQPIGMTSEYKPVDFNYMPTPENIKSLSKVIRQLGNDTDPINFPDGVSPDE